MTSLYGVPHGQTLATLLPHVMAFNIAGGAMIDKYAEVATAFGVRDPTLSAVENAHRAIDAITRLSIQVGTAKSIEMLGGSARDIPELTTRALTACLCVVVFSAGLFFRSRVARGHMHTNTSRWFFYRTIRSEYDVTP